MCRIEGFQLYYRSIFFLYFIAFLCAASAFDDIWGKVPCYKEYKPENCDLSDVHPVTLDDYDRCGPAAVQDLVARDYYTGAAGRRITYVDNIEAFNRIRLVPRLLRSVAHADVRTNVLGLDLDFPIGVAPTAVQKFANPEGEKATVEGLSPFRTIFTLDCFGSTSIEEIGERAKGTGVHLWLQVYMFVNRSLTLELVRRAERSGFVGIVLSSDFNVAATLTCDTRRKLKLPPWIKSENAPFGFVAPIDPGQTFQDLEWLTRITKLPVISKGILSGEDAIQAIEHGAAAIYVSNHGGRQLDGDPATIDALTDVVIAVREQYPDVPVLMDGGVRRGHDVYKALARGATMVLLGRSILWGLALGGAEGVRKGVKQLRDEFTEVMRLAGSASIDEISINTLIPPESNFNVMMARDCS